MIKLVMFNVLALTVSLNTSVRNPAFMSMLKKTRWGLDVSGTKSEACIPTLTSVSGLSDVSEIGWNGLSRVIRKVLLMLVARSRSFFIEFKSSCDRITRIS